MPRRTSRKKLPPYTSDTLAVSRRMVGAGPHHEEQSIIYDLTWRYKNLKSTLAYYDRTQGKAIAEEANKLADEARRRIEAYPDPVVARRFMDDLFRSEF